jgi:hypothetical protein
VGYFNVLWTSTGYTGAPGYTKLHFFASNSTRPTVVEVNNAVTATRALLAATSTYLPTGVTYAFQNPIQWFNDSGTLLGEVSSTAAPANVVGSGGSNYPGGAGAVIFWDTGSLNGGHKIRGRTYIVPLSTTAFANDGTLATGLVSGLQAAVNTYVGTNPQPCVNSRKLGQDDRADTTVTVLGGTVKDRSAFLRTRRT